MNSQIRNVSKKLITSSAIVFALLSTLMLSSVTQASSVETYTFTKPEYQIRFHELNKILRCPKCQNQNLADSNSSISQDLRREVKRLIEEGRNDDQITEFMVMRYGSFVLYKPKLDKITYFLWYGPIGFGIFGLIMVIFIVMRQKRKKLEQESDTSTPNSNLLNAQEQAEIDKLLNK